MGNIYDSREGPAYRDAFTPYKNRNIDKWWTGVHDAALVRLVDEYQWNWYWEVSTTIEPLIPDPIRSEVTSQSAWYNKVMNYAITRAKALGLTSRIRQPERKVCPLCQNQFTEDSLPHPLFKRLGADHLDFCSPCLKDIVLRDTGRADASGEVVCDYLRHLTELLQRIPPQGYGEGMEDWREIPDQIRLNLMLLMQRKPTTTRVKELFGSWLKALIESGVLASGTRETMRGTQTVAADGHVCLSLGEKTIDDYLHAHGIEHRREIPYPDGSGYRVDFMVGDVFIEYFGLAGDAKYDERIAQKLKACKTLGIQLVEVYPRDLAAISKLADKLAAAGIRQRSTALLSPD